MKRAVFLDRDGVLNRATVRDGKPYPPRTVDEVEILPGVEEACERLVIAGFVLVVVTNQPDIARGTTPRAEVTSVNDRLSASLPLLAVMVCPHDDADGCGCRKPRPGLLISAAREFGISLADSVMVGDRWRDIEAGKAAGCSTVWIKYDYREPQPEQVDLTTESLLDAVGWIVNRKNQ